MYKDVLLAIGLVLLKGYLRGWRSHPARIHLGEARLPNLRRIFSGHGHGADVG